MVQPESVDSIPGMEAGVTMTVRIMTPEEVQADLDRYEREFGMTSSEFLKRFYAGELDFPGVIGWEFACDLANELGFRLN